MKSTADGSVQREEQKRSYSYTASKTHALSNKHSNSKMRGKINEKIADILLAGMVMTGYGKSEKDLG